jgi:alkanesulfonate monooxygenase SsuD/methylene tetrahydromethanopterin reductase-like flavin-dependent oxidoreductase (luciferase family)
MEIGIDSFVAFLPASKQQAFVPASQRMADLLAEVETADRVGLDAFGIGEHHRAEFLDAALPSFWQQQRRARQKSG